MTLWPRPPRPQSNHGGADDLVHYHIQVAVTSPAGQLISSNDQIRNQVTQKRQKRCHTSTEAKRYVMFHVYTVICYSPPFLTARFRSRSDILHSRETNDKSAIQKSGEENTSKSHITDRGIAFIGISLVFLCFFLTEALRLTSLCDFTVFGKFGWYGEQGRYFSYSFKICC